MDRLGQEIHRNKKHLRLTWRQIADYIGDGAEPSWAAHIASGRIFAPVRHPGRLQRLCELLGIDHFTALGTRRMLAASNNVPNPLDGLEPEVLGLLKRWTPAMRRHLVSLAPSLEPLLEALGPATTKAASSSTRISRLKIGWHPLLYTMLFTAAAEKGWFRDELDVEVEYARFTSGAPMLQAIAAGQIDVAYIGSGPALTAAHEHMPVKVVAVINKDGYAFVATSNFADIYASNPSAAAFAEFQRQEGHKLRIATFPRGSTPDVFLRYWLTRLGLNPERDVEIVPMGEDKVVAAAVAGQVDATMIGEPVITLVQSSNPKFKVVLWSEQILPDQISTVVMIRQSLIDHYPEVVEKLVELHARAIKLFQGDKEFWAQTAAKWVGTEVLPLEVARQAVRSRAVHLVGNSRTIADSILLYDRFLVEDGTFARGIAVEDVFDFRWETVSGFSR